MGVDVEGRDWLGSGVDGREASCSERTFVIFSWSPSSPSSGFGEDCDACLSSWSCGSTTLNGKSCFVFAQIFALRKFAEFSGFHWINLLLTFLTPVPSSVVPC